MANFVSYEGIDSDVQKVWKRLQSNQLNGIITGFPTGSGKQTVNAFLNNGISKATSKDPYAGIPHDELKLKKLEDSDGSVDTNVTDTNDTAANDNIIDTAGLTATLTGKYRSRSMLASRSVHTHPRRRNQHSCGNYSTGHSSDLGSCWFRRR